MENELIILPPEVEEIAIKTSTSKQVEVREKWAIAEIDKV